MVPFWLPKWSQVGPKKFKKLKREGSKTDIILKAAQEAAQDGLGEVLGPSWEGLGVAWKGSGAAPGGILGAFWEQNSVRTANQQFGATTSNEEGLEPQKAIAKAKTS